MLVAAVGPLSGVKAETTLGQPAEPGPWSTCPSLHLTTSTREMFESIKETVCGPELPAP